MPRIIAGFAGSLTLKTPQSGTRPTSDRVREGIFSALEARDAVQGAQVLDLYAGSGALGLEALSRGALGAVLVEQAAPAVRVLRENARLIAARSHASVATRIVAEPVRRYLEHAAGSVFTLVFLDPPYDLGDADLAGDLRLVAAVTEPGAIVVVERSSRSPEPEWPRELTLDRTRTYGETAVHYAIRTEEQAEDASAGVAIAP